MHDGAIQTELFKARPEPAQSKIAGLHRANGRGRFGSQTAAETPRDPQKTPEKQTVGTVAASHKMFSLQALSSSLNASTAKKSRLG